MPEINATVILVLFIVLVALVFDFTNGFHDAANSIATVVSTRVLSPRYAVMWAATFNFIAFAVFGTRVAKTIGGDLVRIDLIQQDHRLYVLCAGLMGAIIWNLITWYLGLPTSSSHALVGGYAGAAVAAYHGVSGLLKPEGWIKTLIFIVASPVIGFVMGFALMVTVYWIFHRWTPAQVDKTFRRGQLLSAAAYSLGHGGNDAQKTMGIITAVLATGGMFRWAPRSPSCGQSGDFAQRLRERLRCLAPLRPEFPYPRHTPSPARLPEWDRRRASRQLNGASPAESYGLGF